MEVLYKADSSTHPHGDWQTPGALTSHALQATVEADLLLLPGLRQVRAGWRGGRVHGRTAQVSFGETPTAQTQAFSP